MAYSFKRPAIYESHANLLIEPQDPDRRDQDTSSHDIALQSQVLLSRDLLMSVLDTLPPDGTHNESESLTLSSLRPMLSVISVPDSAVIKLLAEGSQKQILPVIVNTWVARYVDLNSRIQQTYSNSATTSIEQQLGALNRKISAKREALKSFRDQYDIVSMERDENKILAKLKGLNNSLSKATETRTNMESQLIAITQAIANGKWAGKYKKTAELERLETEAEALGEVVRDYETRYTSKFFQLDKDVRATVNKLRRIEEKIEHKYQALQTAAVEEVEQEIKSARQAEMDLGAQIAANEKQASAFSARFLEHESLKEDLARLENLSRDYQEKLVAMDIKSDGDMLQVKVLEKAFMPDAPVRPDYMRDSGICLAASLVLGVFAILLYDLLTRPARQPHDPTAYSVTYNQMFQGTPPSLQAPLDHPQPDNLLAPVEHMPLRELSEVEIKGLFNCADNLTRLLMAALLNGLSLAEAARLKWGNINFEENELKTPPPVSRILFLTAFFRSVLMKNLPEPMDAEAYILPDKNGGTIALDKLDGCILQAAQDAQVREPQQIASLTLRHTYVAFLVRQGVPLSEITEMVGPIPNEYRAAYGIMRPPGAGISIKNATRVMPSLLEMV